MPIVLLLLCTLASLLITKVTTLWPISILQVIHLPQWFFIGGGLLLLSWLMKD